MTVIFNIILFSLHSPRTSPIPYVEIYNPKWNVRDESLRQEFLPGSRPEIGLNNPCCYLYQDYQEHQIHDVKSDYVTICTRLRQGTGHLVRTSGSSGRPVQCTGPRGAGSSDPSLLNW